MQIHPLPHQCPTAPLLHHYIKLYFDPSWPHPLKPLIFVDQDIENITKSVCLCLQILDFTIFEFPVEKNEARQGPEDKARISCGGGPNCTIKSSAQNMDPHFWDMSNCTTCLLQIHKIGKIHTHFEKIKISIESQKLDVCLSVSIWELFDMPQTLDETNNNLVNAKKK